MFEIDMEAIEPIGEFGSRAWCDACASYGVKILEAADLPGDLNWGFSELYTYPPDRLISEDWSQSGYHFMVMDGVVSGGASVPQTCLDQEGFHAKIRWAYICNQSATKYGSAGQRKRSERGSAAFATYRFFRVYAGNGWSSQCCLACPNSESVKCRCRGGGRAS